MKQQRWEYRQKHKECAFDPENQFEELSTKMRPKLLFACATSDTKNSTILAFACVTCRDQPLDETFNPQLVYLPINIVLNSLSAKSLMKRYGSSPIIWLLEKRQLTSEWSSIFSNSRSECFRANNNGEKCDDCAEFHFWMERIRDYTVIWKRIRVSVRREIIVPHICQQRISLLLIIHIQYSRREVHKNAKPSLNP